MTTRLALLTCVWLATLAVGAAPAARPVNLVFILTDNQGAWTLGCYGNRDIRTPHIDRLAADGIRFTRAYSSNPVCSPTRATYLTGLIPSQHGVHCYLGGEKPSAQMGDDAYDVIREFPSLPKILKQAGYVCGLTGKWHLGDSLHPQEGFSYWVTMPAGNTTEFYDAQVIENGEVRKEPTYLTEFWTRHAVKFIEQNQARPFFLYVPYNGPYNLGRLLLNPARNRHAAYYADKDLPSFPKEPAHPWMFHNKEYVGNPVSARRVAAETSGVDDGVGEILATLKRLGLEQNTLVVYAADQGWMGGQNGIWGMGDHTRPLGAHHLMMQVPLIFRQPGRIPAGRTTDLLVSNYDFLTSVLHYLGLGPQAPAQSPGHDYSPALLGQPVAWTNEVYYEMESTRAICNGEWKWVRRIANGPDELHHLTADPLERTNLANLPQHAALQRELSAKLDAFYRRHADPQFDLWQHGQSKAGMASSAPGPAAFPGRGLWRPKPQP